jgi:hypothetical protein
MDILDENTEELTKDLSYEEKIYQMRKKAEDTFDKLIVYLSSGGIVLSLTYIKPKDGMEIPPLFKYILLAFSLSLVIILLSHKFAVLAADAYFNDKECLKKVYNYITHILNWLSLILFIIGLVLIFFILI